MPDSIFQPWRTQDRLAWGHVPTVLEHSLKTHPLFQRAALAALIDAMPRHAYSLIHMGPLGARKSWLEGDLGGLSGSDVIRWIENGRYWINLRKVQDFDPRYRDVLKQIYGEIAAQTGTRVAINQTMGILISSPHAQVYYHADLFGQALWQIEGRKRVYVYPNHAPFLTRTQLETIAVNDLEVDLPYQDWFDQYADVLELGPGSMAHWPLNAPHRVQNLGMLNVSVTTEHMTPEILRRYHVHFANGLLKARLGWAAEGTSTRGLSYWIKAAAQNLLRRGRWLATVRAQKRPVSFVLDRDVVGGMRPIGAGFGQTDLASDAAE